MSVTTWLYFRW